jgi:hypothetical protein
MSKSIKVSHNAATMALELVEETQDNVWGERIGTAYTPEAFMSVDHGTPSSLALGLVCQAILDADFELPVLKWPDAVDELVASVGFSRSVEQNIRKALDSLGYMVVAKGEKP